MARAHSGFFEVSTNFSHSAREKFLISNVTYSRALRTLATRRLYARIPYAPAAATPAA
jgi:hypothetical protein